METDHHWVTVWAAPVQGPFPVGNTLLQPDQSLAFPDPARGARDLTFRLLVRPSLWGAQLRLRLSNVFGSKAVTFSRVSVALRSGGAALLPRTNRAVTFGREPAVSIPQGEDRWSDAVDLDGFAPSVTEGRDLAVSLAIHGESGRMTWHAKALSTSYLSPPGSGMRCEEAGEESFSLTASSWFFLDAIDMALPKEAFGVVALGDSLTEGTGSTFGGFDRWTDVLARRLRLAGIRHVAIVNSGIGGNQIAGPQFYDADHPFAGGPSAISRLSRDVLGLSGVKTVIWLQGINDFSRNGRKSYPEVRDAMTEGVALMRGQRPDLTIVGTTLPSALGSTHPAHGFEEEDDARRSLNAFIRASEIFDSVVDVDAACLDPATGRLKPEFCPSSVEGPGDGIHLNRAGNLHLAELLIGVARMCKP